MGWGEPCAAVFDVEYLGQQQERYKKVFPQWDIVGWYGTGQEVVPEVDLQIHRSLSNLNESPVYLLFNPRADLGGAGAGGAGRAASGAENGAGGRAAGAASTSGGTGDNGGPGSATKARGDERLTPPPRPLHHFRVLFVLHLVSTFDVK